MSDVSEEVAEEVYSDPEAAAEEALSQTVSDEYAADFEGTDPARPTSRQSAPQSRRLLWQSHSAASSRLSASVESIHDEYNLVEKMLSEKVLVRWKALVRRRRAAAKQRTIQDLSRAASSLRRSVRASDVVDAVGNSRLKAPLLNAAVIDEAVFSHDGRSPGATSVADDGASSVTSPPAVPLEDDLSSTPRRRPSDIGEDLPHTDSSNLSDILEDIHSVQDRLRRERERGRSAGPRGPATTAAAAAAAASSPKPVEGWALKQHPAAAHPAAAHPAEPVRRGRRRPSRPAGRAPLATDGPPGAAAVVWAAEAPAPGRAEPGAASKPPPRGPPAAAGRYYHRPRREAAAEWAGPARPPHMRRPRPTPSPQRPSPYEVPLVSKKASAPAAIYEGAPPRHSEAAAQELLSGRPRRSQSEDGRRGPQPAKADLPPRVAFAPFGRADAAPGRKSAPAGLRRGLPAAVYGAYIPPEPRRNYERRHFAVADNVRGVIL